MPQHPSASCDGRAYSYAITDRSAVRSSGRLATRAEARPDILVVISDVELRHVNGCELARTIRQRWPRIGVILTSGRAAPAAEFQKNGRELRVRVEGLSLSSTTGRSRA